MTDPLPDDYRCCRDAVRQFDWLTPFEPHRLVRGGLLQTLSIKLLRPSLSIEDWPNAIGFDVPDDASPPNRMSGYFLPANSGGEAKATALVIHGMGGHAESGYMRSMAETLLNDGYSVILWNGPGAGASAETCRTLGHPGSTDDLRQLLAHLSAERPSWIEHGLVAVAFSLGANRLLRYLAETGDDAAFRAAVTVSTPLDLERTSRNLRRGWNRILDRFLLKKQRDEVLRPNADLTDEERETLRNVKTVWQLDDRFTAPRYGYDGAEDYYGAVSAANVLDDITTPTLLFHSLDDPVVDNEVYARRDWQPGGPLFPAVTKFGGHTGFLEAAGTRWHERHTPEFFDAMLPQKSTTARNR